MTKFRMIRAGLWMDQDFLSVSPEAKLIYLYLMSGPTSTNINGLSVVTTEWVRGRVGVPTEWVHRGYAELKNKGLMLHDENFDVVFLPREIIENPPRTWQQMEGYLKTLQEIPDCPIRNEVLEIFEAVANEAKDERVRSTYRVGTEWVRSGYRVKYKDKYKEKVKEEVKEIQSKQNDIQKTELQMITIAPAAPSVIDYVADGFEGKKEFTKRKKRAPKDESGIWEIRKAFESGYRHHYSTDKTPGWGTKERSVAQMCLNKKGVTGTVELLRDHWFLWNNSEVIKGGHSFASGYASFGQKIDELQAAILNPDRMRELKISALNEKQGESQLKRESEINRIADNLKRLENLKNNQNRIDGEGEVVDF